MNRRFARTYTYLFLPCGMHALPMTMNDFVCVMHMSSSSLAADLVESIPIAHVNHVLRWECPPPFCVRRKYHYLSLCASRIPSGSS